jgi:hypothetical protein
MPNYLYKHNDTECEFTKEYGHTFHLIRSISERDSQCCPACNCELVRVFEGTLSVKYDHLSNREKLIKKDLIEVNKIEKDIALNRIKGGDVGRAKQEIHKLKFS